MNNEQLNNGVTYPTWLVLVASFTLSAIAYNVAHSHEVPVQHLEFEEMVIQPRVETYEFDEVEIYVPVEVIEMDEFAIIAQSSPSEANDDSTVPDGDSSAFCFLYPERCNDAEGDEGGSDDSDEEC